MALNRYTDFIVQEFNGQAAEDTPPPSDAVPYTPAGAKTPAPATKDTAKKPATTPAPAASASH
jgi:hypothetical protein